MQTLLAKTSSSSAEEIALSAANGNITVIWDSDGTPRVGGRRVRIRYVRESEDEIIPVQKECLQVSDTLAVCTKVTGKFTRSIPQALKGKGRVGLRAISPSKKKVYSKGDTLEDGAMHSFNGTEIKEMLRKARRPTFADTAEKREIIRKICAKSRDNPVSAILNAHAQDQAPPTVIVTAREEDDPTLDDKAKGMFEESDSSEEEEPKENSVFKLSLDSERTAYRARVTLLGEGVIPVESTSKEVDGLRAENIVRQQQASSTVEPILKQIFEQERAEQTRRGEVQIHDWDNPTVYVPHSGTIMVIQNRDGSLNDAMAGCRLEELYIGGLEVTRTMVITKVLVNGIKEERESYTYSISWDMRGRPIDFGYGIRTAPGYFHREKSRPSVCDACGCPHSNPLQVTAGNLGLHCPLIDLMAHGENEEDLRTAKAICETSIAAGDEVKVINPVYGKKHTTQAWRMLKYGSAGFTPMQHRILTGQVADTLYDRTEVAEKDQKSWGYTEVLLERAGRVDDVISRMCMREHIDWQSGLVTERVTTAKGGKEATFRLVTRTGDFKKSGIAELMV